MRTLWVTVLLVGCGSSLQLNMVESAYRKPSNVAVYFSVDTSEGEPVAGLKASDFEVYEDDSLVSTHESKQTIVNPELAAAHYTLLLVDMSGSVSESEQVPAIVAAAREFVAELQSHQRVALYAFDGSETLHRFQDFAAARRTEQTLQRLQGFRTQDPSTNLNGAVILALKELEQALGNAKEPLRFGTLVVFTDGTDRAARVSTSEARRAIAESELDVFAIGVGTEIDEDTLSRIGVNGYVLVTDSQALTQAFRAISARIVAFTRRYYLLSYCSPARAGEHEVTVKAIDPASKQSGTLRYRFDAKGFRAQCNPRRPPPFDTSGRALGTARRGGAPRGMRLQVSADLQGGMADPELGLVQSTSPTPASEPQPNENAPTGRSLDELDNELPPGLQPKP